MFAFLVTPGRVLRLSNPHARARARLGRMPGSEAWRYIAEAGDLDATIQRMRENGLGHWVGDLPRSPDVPAIEGTLIQGLIQLVRDLRRWLPPGWGAVRRWLDDGVGLIFVRELLRLPGAEPALDIDPVLSVVAAAPMERRRAILAETRYARYMDDGAHPFDRWLSAFSTVQPPAYGREGYVLTRLEKLVTGHLEALREARLQWRRAADPTGLDSDVQWRRREALAHDLRDLLGGYPFHAGFFLTYALLELLQLERCRALLMARAYGWDATGVV